MVGLMKWGWRTARLLCAHGTIYLCFSLRSLGLAVCRLGPTRWLWLSSVLCDNGAALAMQRPPMRDCRVRSPGEGQVAVNALQTLEVLTKSRPLLSSTCLGVLQFKPLTLPALPSASACCNALSSNARVLRGHPGTVLNTHNPASVAARFCNSGECWLRRCWRTTAISASVPWTPPRSPWLQCWRCRPGASRRPGVRVRGTRVQDCRPGVPIMTCLCGSEQWVPCNVLRATAFVVDGC